MAFFWKIKRLVGFIMFVASIIAFIAFGINIGIIIDLFREGSGFQGFAEALAATMNLLATPLILFTLGLIALLIPRPRRDRDNRDRG
ncbi:MAG: hypothetical protein FWE03_06960 [Firmicutes bacterium]|nr:hypothetical protein [Bacillota bacterium]